MLVVFTVVKKEEKKFTPPKAVERPKMKLRKPKVKVKKTSKPKPTTRIVTKVNRASMPDIQLPEMSGMGEGLGGGIEGFDMMPDLSEVTIFGTGQSIGNDFVGTFYDFKRDRSGRDIPHSLDRAAQDIKEFVRSGWRASKLSRYYRSPKNLYATTFVMTAVPSSVAPWAFGEHDTIGYLWMVHYKGKLVHTEPITFRFWGYGDDFMAVAVDGELVLSTGWSDYAARITPQWQTSSPDSHKYWLGNGRAVVGDWITLEPGTPLDMEILATEMPGGTFSAALLVEVKGVEYERNRQNGPLLPIFRTEQPSLDLIDAIYMDLATGEACVTNGPIFRDYELPAMQAAQPEPEPTVEPPEPRPENSLRTWNGTDGKTMEAKLLTVIGDKAVLESPDGRQRKIPIDRFSAGDRKFIELANPPKFNIDFSKQSSQRIIKDSPIISGSPPKVLDYVFSARLAQTSAGVYNHELKVEFFAIGEETNGDNFILLDRQETHFTPTNENGRSHTFRGNKVTLLQTFAYDRRGEIRGQKYGGYLVVVTDARGRTIDHGTSNKWLLGMLDQLRELPLKCHFDKTGTRVYAPRAKTILY
ncbi:MAG: hypothetical protein DRP64_14075 [Verrucomicrobia bacterium]|nr:MAG: hypothetical protein DRP64_14075 [Verrucomicrobiota bacterium]